MDKLSATDEVKSAETAEDNCSTAEVKDHNVTVKEETTGGKNGEVNKVTKKKTVGVKTKKTKILFHEVTEKKRQEVKNENNYIGKVTKEEKLAGASENAEIQFLANQGISASTFYINVLAQLGGFPHLN